jgi:uncharacterized membrane protein
LWALGRVASSARVEAWLRQLPGTVLVAIVVPAVASGPAGVLALLATVLVAMRTGKLPLTLLVGVGTVWLLRHVL